MVGRRPSSFIPFQGYARLPLLLLLIVFLYSARGGIINAELGEEILTLRQIQFESPIMMNEIGTDREVGRPREEGTGIFCDSPGFFVGAPDGCNRCYCGDDGELTHKCTRAYCPPNFPSGQRKWIRRKTFSDAENEKVG